MVVDDEAACAALTKGAAENKVALMLVYAMWAVVARYDIAIGMERVPTNRNPAELPSREQALSSKTEQRMEIASLDET